MVWEWEYVEACNSQVKKGGLRSRRTISFKNVQEGVWLLTALANRGFDPIVKEVLAGQDRLLSFVGQWEAQRPAVFGEGGEVWTYGELQDFFHSVAQEKGLAGRRVGILVSDRVWAGLLALAVMDCATCIPISPQLSERELGKSLEKLEVEVLLCAPSDERPSLRGGAVELVKVFWEGKDLRLERVGEVAYRESGGNEEALVLQTSGSTGEPKAVALTRENLLHSMASLVESLQLKPEDVCLNLLPMVHVGGLVDLLLAPLAAGGTVHFAEPRDPVEVLRLLETKGVTWLQGAPAILGSLVRASESSPRHCLRLVRSVSAPLSPSLSREVAQFFGVPVIEIYGMSETAGVITSNPLPPRERKIGSVGLPVRCEVAIRGEGEVWVRGANVFEGYAPEFRSGSDWDGEWFFTGDEGRVDGEGYLFLTGRIKEQINRGGQKVSPREVDQVVEAWAEVKEAASFGFSHPTLGEEVGLALVLEGDHRLEDGEIRRRLSESLASYKRPKVFHRLKALPRNEGRKLQRHLLPDLVMKTGSRKEEVLSETEARVRVIWLAILKIGAASLDDDFFELGGDSLSAVALLKRLKKAFSCSFQELVFYENTTIRAIAAFVDREEGNAAGARSSGAGDGLSPRVRKRLNRMLFSWSGVAPFKGAYCRELPRSTPAKYGRFFWCGNESPQIEGMRAAVGDHYQVVGFRTLRSVQKEYLRNYRGLVEVYANQIEKMQPEGEIVLGGFCDGGKVMEQVAALLEERGVSVRQLVVLDHVCSTPLNVHLSMVFSRLWRQNPLFLWEDPDLVWRKLVGNRFGVLDWEGKHTSFGQEEFHERLRTFLLGEAERAGEEGLAHRVERVAPSCRLEWVERPPRLFSLGGEYRARVIVTNTGAETLHPGSGVVLHARWKDFTKPKLGICMKTTLDEPLLPGEAREFSLVIKSPRKKRLYRLQISMWEEGGEWPRSPQFLECWILTK